MDMQTNNQRRSISGIVSFPHPLIELEDALSKKVSSVFSFTMISHLLKYAQSMHLRSMLQLAAMSIRKTPLIGARALMNGWPFSCQE